MTQRVRYAAPAHFDYVTMVIVALLAFISYARALHFAFFNDDPTGNFAWLEARSLVQLWTNSEGYGFYRPVAFTLWRGLRVLFGGYHSAAFHGVSLLIHASNTVLIWLLARTLGGRRVYAWLVVALFVTFPFNFEAVAYVAALFHPLVTFWILLTLWLYEQAKQTDKRYYLALAHLTIGLGLFSHESGVMIPFILFAWEIGTTRHSIPEVFRRVIPFFLAPIIFICLWFTVPKTGEMQLPTLTHVSKNLLPVLQTITYPLLPLVSLQQEETVALWLLGISSAIGLGSVAWWIGRIRLWLFALLWVGFTVAPSVISLEPVYFLGSPRLHYLPAVGVAVLWGILALALTRIRPSVIQWGGQIVLVLALVLPPLPYISCQMDFYAEASDIVRGMVTRAIQVANSSTADPLVFVNVPLFFTSYPDHPDGCPNPYLWAPMGSVVIPPYADPTDFIYMNGGPARAARTVTLLEYSPTWVTQGEPQSLDELASLIERSPIFVFNLSEGDFLDLSAHWQPEGNELVPLARFGEVINLVSASSTRRDDAVAVALTWQALEPTNASYSVFVHLYRDSAGLVAQHDGPPVEGYVPTSLWRKADLVTDYHEITFDSPLQPGTYTVAVGLYDPEDNERLPVTVEGEPVSDRVYIIQQFTVE